MRGSPTMTSRRSPGATGAACWERAGRREAVPRIAGHRAGSRPRLWRAPNTLAIVSELPQSVRVREVGPRDGFQNEPEVIPTEDKVRVIDALAATGLRQLEVTSFVRPDVIPQLADAEDVLAAIERPPGVSYSVLIPNERGLERALEHRDRFDEVNLFLSATETHNRRNVNRSIAASLEGIKRTITRALEEELRCEGVISVAFGCPYEGEVPPDRVFELA